ncbi:MAG: hypothetical protein AB7P40_13305 [Chloroflexota bacterium]
MWFSEAMNQASVQSAFSLKQCTTSACSAFTTTWTAPTNGSLSWYGDSNNVMRWTPTSSMAADTWYQISVSTAATDLSGRAISGTFTSKFQTDSSTDLSAPSVTLTAPITTTWTSDSTYTLAGSTGGLLLKAYRDNAPTGSFGGEDTLVATGYTYGGATDFSLQVPLNAGAANRFVVTAADTSNNVSSPAFTPVVYQGEVRTLAGIWGTSEGNDSINVFATYLGDTNGNNSATVRWRTPAFGGTYNAPVAMTRYADYLGYTITGLAPGTTYRVEVTYTDPDGIASGTAVSSQDITTSGGTGSGLITNVIMNHIRTANRAPQGVTFTASVTGSAKYVQFAVQTGVTKTSTCLTPSGGVATYVWDGTDGSGNPVSDNYWGWTATAYPLSATGCSGTAQTMGAYVYVSNANSIAMSPTSAAVTIGAGQSACITATARNRQGYLVEDGAAITFSYTSAPSGGSYTLTQPATGKIGSAAPGCTAPAAGSGQAVAKITVNTAYASTLYITATMNTQLSGTTLTTVSGSTSVNDPPATPEDLVVTPVSMAATSKLPSVLSTMLPGSGPSAGLTARFRAPRHGNVAGYYLLIGTTSGSYTRQIDLGTSTMGNVDGLVPGQRYYVAVQAYNKVKLASAASAEQMVFAPVDTVVASLSLQTTSSQVQDLLLPGQPVQLRATAKNRDGQPVSGAPISFSGPRGLTFDPSNGITGTDGTFITRVAIDETPLRIGTIRGASGAVAATLELPVVLPTTTPTVSLTSVLTPTTTALPSLTPAAAASQTAAPTVTTAPASTTQPTATATASATPTLSASPTQTSTATRTPTPTGTAQPTPTSTPTNTLQPTATTDPTQTPTPAPTGTTPPTPTTMPSNTPLPTSTSTSLPTATTEPTDTPTPAPTSTAPPTPTSVPSNTPAPTSTSLPTATPHPKDTPTPVPTSAGTVGPSGASSSARR